MEDLLDMWEVYNPDVEDDLPDRDGGCRTGG
jgi:hypothetical protein